MKGKSIADNYVDFHVNFIIEFCKELLPEEYEKILSIKQFKINCTNYYTKVKIAAQDTLIDLDNNTKERILNSYNINKIRIKDIQDIFFSLFGTKTILNLMNDVNRNIFIKLATTIYIASEYDTYMLQHLTENFEQANALLTSKLDGLVDVLLLKELKEKSTTLKDVYVKALEKDRKFDNEITLNNSFQLTQKRIIKKSEEIDDLYVCKLDIMNDQINSTIIPNPDLARVTNKKRISNTLQKIKLQLLLYYLIRKRLSNEKSLFLIDLTSDFITIKTNNSYLLKNIEICREGIALSLNYDDYTKYVSVISELQKEGFKICCEKGEKDIDFKKTRGINYILLKYEDKIDFLKTISEVQNFRMATIVLNVPIDKKETILTNNKILYYSTNE